MFSNYKFFKMISLLIILTLPACGTFEVGIENNFVPETPEMSAVPESTAVPTSQPETQIPIMNDEQAIAAALAEKLGQPVDQLAISFAALTGQHAMGGVSNGYFLAAKQGDSWIVVYDGQATPACEDIDLYQFPADMVPECLGHTNQLVVRTDGGDAYSEVINGLVSLDCSAGSLGASPGSVESVACNIQDGLRSRNISALLGYMSDPFIIGYWLSEGVRYTPQDFLNDLPDLYNFNDPDYTPRLTFTTDRSQFPDLPSRNLEGNFGPDVNVVEVIYSQGWGIEGDQEALIYLSEDSAGNFKWHGMLYGKFDYSP